MGLRASCALLCPLLVFGCGDHGGSDPFATSASAGAGSASATVSSGDTERGSGVGESAGESTSDAGDEHGEDAGTGGIPKLDVASDTGAPPFCGPNDEDCACNAVDLLFVIDNSGSMQPYQDALADTFPLFVDAMLAALPPATDLHVGISSTSFGSPSAGGKGSSGCSNAQHDAEALEHHYPPPSQPNGQNGGQGRLYEYQGKRYFATNTSDDPSALEAWFTGAAKSVGEQGSNWEMVAAGGAWVAHPDNAAHNAGFIRDTGAVLVIFVLTDEYDNSPESAAVYHDLVVDAKTQCGGDLCVVTGGLTPPCVPMTPENVLGQFLSSFGSAPVIGSIGTPENTAHYPEVLGAALAEVIAQTCEAIPPAG